MLGISAELNRTPFDIVEAESELVAGYHTEYSGIKFALVQMAEFGGVIAASAVASTLFLGGWSGPFLSGQLGALWFLLKLGFFVFLFIWIRGTFPRLRIDQIMAFAWKFLFPMSLINIVVTTLEVFWLRDETGALSTGDLGLMAAINIPLAIVAVAAFATLVKDKVRPPRSTFGTGAWPLRTTLPAAGQGDGN
jgi:hypothetical protein